MSHPGTSSNQCENDRGSQAYLVHVGRGIIPTFATLGRWREAPLLSPIPIGVEIETFEGRRLTPARRTCRFPDSGPPEFVVMVLPIQGAFLEIRLRPDISVKDISTPSP
jgi:hypothetical protein